MSKPQIIAFYLPQFHTIPENDSWWGEGFTEWVNVKKARPLFRGHLQPRLPLNNNYYSLDDPNSLRWQANIANEYGIYGLCFYHYWFNGKLLLEKPAELLLKNSNIPMRFCFSWANEPWTRSWDGKSHQVIMPQDYGNEEDWRRHIDYLMPFFKDSRYIKVEDRPMFLVYKPQSIRDILPMMKLWDEIAIEKGFRGMHFVETLRGIQCDKRNLPFRAKVEFEPIRANMQQSFVALNYKRIRRSIIQTINEVLNTSIPLNKPFTFSEVSRRSIQKLSPEGTYGGLFVGWDNTPRRGLAATIIQQPTREEFRSYLMRKAEITQEQYHTDYLFINAWNEWAEGAFLEPDEKLGYMLLEVIKEYTS